MRGWVDLDGEIIAGIEDLDKQGKTVGWRQSNAEYQLVVLGPEFVECHSRVRAVHDDGLLLFAVTDFPGFAIGGVVRERAVVDGFEASAAPDALHVEWGKKDRFHGDEREGIGCKSPS